MADQIAASIPGIDLLRGKIEEQFTLIAKDEQELTEAVRALNGMWEGEAHEVYTKDFEELLEAFRELNEAGMELVNFERTAVSEYSKADQEVEDVVRTI